LSKGRFIVIEGADGVGSTTQAKALVSYLNEAGRKAVFTAEPSGGDIGKLARSYLRAGSEQAKETLALLFAADRLQHYYSEIAPALEAGVDVVSDRYVLSSLVYQSLDLPTSWVKQLNRFAPPPDATILIALPFPAAWNRICGRLESGSTKEIFDRRDLQERIHTLYEELLHEVSGIVVDGRGLPEEVLERVKGVLPP